jgi:3-methyladenine DNA glycosylase AlkD
MKTKELIVKLRQHKNPEKIKPMENYMQNQFQFLGLQAKERRELAKEFLKEQVALANKEATVDWEMLFLLWALPEREFQLVGLDYLKRVEKHFILDDLANLRKLVLTKSWWDTVDFLAKNIGALVLKEPELAEEMRNWSLEENLWLRRVSILHQLAFKENTNSSLLKEVILNNLDDEEFFIQKAIGWALREYAKTDEAWVVSFVTSFHQELSALSVREALKNVND